MDEALERKERLRAFKQAAQLVEDTTGPTQQADEAADPEKPILKFRNYVITDDRIKHEQVAPAQPPTYVEPTVDSRPEDADQEELIVSMAPKKANWDLKRDVQPLLDKLERRTQKVMIEMMQEDERRRMQESMEQN